MSIQMSIQEDLRMISQPEDWPWWPVLPLKKRDGGRQDPRYCGLLFAGNLTRVYFTNMDALGDLDPRPQPWEQVLAGIEYHDYASVEALVADYAVD